MVRLSKAIGMALVVAGFAALASDFYVQLRYYSKMPRAPDPSAGRTYPFTANHSQVYVTEEEAHLGRLVGMSVPFGILGAVIGIYIVHRTSRR
jgi:hypothetical protein